MKQYTEAELKLIQFQSEDVIATSSDEGEPAPA